MCTFLLAKSSLPWLWFSGQAVVPEVEAKLAKISGVFLTSGFLTISLVFDARCFTSTIDPVLACARKAVLAVVALSPCSWTGPETTSLAGCDVDF